MRILAQRVRSASVTVDGTVTGSIGQGLLIFLGVGPEDTEQIAEKMAEKLMRLRIFPISRIKSIYPFRMSVALFWWYRSLRCMQTAERETVPASYKLHRPHLPTSSMNISKHTANRPFPLWNPASLAPICRYNFATMARLPSFWIPKN